jgi:hypothetical protein
VATPKGRTLDTFQCPGCGKTILAGVPNCQFCGAPTDVRPKSGSTQSVVAKRTKGYGGEEVLYVLCALLWIGGGGYDLAAAFGKTPMLMETFGGMAYFGMLAGFRTLLGIGLLFRVDLAGIISRVLAVVQIGMSGTTVVLAFVNGNYETAGVAYQGGQVVLAALVFYLVGVVGD